VFVNLETAVLLLPELLLVVAATLILVGGAFYRHRGTWHLAALASFVAAGLLLAFYPPPEGFFVKGPVIVDSLAQSLRWLLVIAGVFFTSVSWQSSSRELAPEQIGSIMFSVAGAMLTVSANELVLLFLGLELMSIPVYMLLFVGRRDRDSAEAAAKYFFLSVVSSAVMLYGMSFLYGIGGTTKLIGAGALPGIRDSILLLGDSPLAAFSSAALLLTLVGLGFKFTAVPFHFYAPDVYQGTTAANAGLLATLPKIAAAAAMVRVVTQCLPIEAGHAWQVLLVLSLLSMTIGNVCALWQRNIRRMLAYSSIAHSGYMLIGMTVAQAGVAMGGSDISTYNGVTALVFYLVVYTFASLGSFAALTAMGSPTREVNSVDDLAGTGRTQPLAAAALAVFMFSLAGIPPLAGFWGKFSLFMSAIDLATQTTGAASTWLIVLSIAAALNAAVAAAYYLRIVGVMYFQAPPAASPSETPLAEQPLQQPGGALAASLACAVLILGAGVRPGPVMNAALRADADVRLIVNQPAGVPVAADENRPLELNYNGRLAEAPLPFPAGER
jgi:NADH-quinone oxidoreductase subunit N